MNLDRIHQAEADELAPIAEAVIARIGELGRPARMALQDQLDKTSDANDQGTLTNLCEGFAQIEEIELDA